MTREPRGDLLERQRAGRGDDRLFVDSDARQGAGFRPGGDDDGLRAVGLAAHLDRARRGDRAPALQPGDLVLLEQELDALGVGGDHIGLVGLHLAPVDGRGGAQEAHLGEVHLGLVQEVAGVKQCLRGDAADVQAGAAEGGAALDHRRFQAELRTAGGADIAAGAGADDDDIEDGIAGRGGRGIRAGHGSGSFVGSVRARRQAEGQGWQMPPLTR